MILQKQKGFTIVELLIVIVVIGILAAITIVAFNGVQDRARVSSVSSALSQAAKKLAVYQVDNPDIYPVDKTALEALGIKDSDTVTYEYTRTTSSPNTYCITATTGTISYKISSSAQAPSVGGCAGHGVGGVSAITNFVLNPSFENGTAVSGGNISASGGSPAVSSAGGVSGPRFLRSTFVNVTTLGWGQHSASVPVGSYMASFYVRSDIGIKFQPYLQGTAVKSTIASSGIVTVPPNTWVRAWTSVNVTTAGTIQVGGYFVQDVTAPTTSNYIDFDAFMLTTGTTTLNYVDGNTSNWVWNGTTNISTSTGPPV